jgi:hypothetical protein
LLTQQTSITVYCLLRQRKTSFRFLFLFAANKQKLPFSVYKYGKRNYICLVPILYIEMHTINIYSAVENGKQKPSRSPDVFFNLFTVCSLYKWNFVVCLFVDEETNGSYPFSNGLNGFASKAVGQFGWIVPPPPPPRDTVPQRKGTVVVTSLCRCNGTAECDDESDEDDCAVCNQSTWPCSDNKVNQEIYFCQY